MTGTNLYYIVRHPMAAATRAVYRVLRWLPIPYQDRWVTALQLLRVQTHVLATDAAQHSEDQRDADRRAGTVLYKSARMWLERRLLSIRSTKFRQDVVADTFTVVVKSLDMPSRMAVEKGKFTVTTFACPFIEDARRTGSDPGGVCARVCGPRHSLFKGVSDAFPFYVNYHATSMMGRGEQVCIKEVTVRDQQMLKRRPRWRRHLPRHGGHGKVTILEEPMDEVSAARAKSLFS